MMAGRPGEISPRQAARLLECHVKTVRGWCRSGHLDGVRRDVCGRYWIRKTSVQRLADPQNDDDSSVF